MMNHFIMRFPLIAILVFLFIAADAQSKGDSAKKKSITFAAIPMINYNRTQGIIVGAMAQVFIK